MHSGQTQVMSMLALATIVLEPQNVKTTFPRSCTMITGNPRICGISNHVLDVVEYKGDIL